MAAEEVEVVVLVTEMERGKVMSPVVVLLALDMFCPSSSPGRTHESCQTSTTAACWRDVLEKGPEEVHQPEVTTTRLSKWTCSLRLTQLSPL